MGTIESRRGQKPWSGRSTCQTPSSSDANHFDIGKNNKFGDVYGRFRNWLFESYTLFLRNSFEPLRCLPPRLLSEAGRHSSTGGSINIEMLSQSFELTISANFRSMYNNILTFGSTSSVGDSYRRRAVRFCWFRSHSWDSVVCTRCDIICEARQCRKKMCYSEEAV